jgi:hypothetical protein
MKEIYLANKQLPLIDDAKKLKYKDIKRIIKHCKTDIFGDKCCLWNGYIPNKTCIPFYLNNIRENLHRLLYINFVGGLTMNDYLRITCETGRQCICLNHIKKFECIVKENYLPCNLENDNVIRENVKNTSVILSFE